MRASRTCILVPTLLATLLMVAPASAYNIYAGIGLDVHQDIPDGSLPFGRLPNDFHVEGYICTANGVPPVLYNHLQDRFPYFDYHLEPIGDCWWYFVADWWMEPGAPGIPYCETIHIGLLFLVEDENTMVDLTGWWTLDGVRVGEIYGGYTNNGFVPLTGFDVSPVPGGQAVRIGNGIMPPIISPPPIMPPGPAPIDVSMIEMDLVSMAPSALPPNWFEELRIGGEQDNWDWVPVLDGDGNDVNPGNPLDFPADSFFDVFFDIEIGEGQPTPATPVTINPGDIFFLRTRRMFINNAGVPEPNMGLWQWHIHEAQSAEACCMPDGSCQDLAPRDCAVWGGMPMGAGSNCGNTVCPGGEQACCMPDGSCQWLPIQACEDAGGFPPPGGYCLGDMNNNGVDDACEITETGACCYGDMVPQCLVTDPVICDMVYQGLWMGPMTTCDDWNGNNIADICEMQDVGACCYEMPILCAVVTEQECIEMLGGEWKGPFTDCFDGDGNNIADICEDQELGACCYEQPRLCMVTTVDYCVFELAGEWKGPGTDCFDGDGNNIADICEVPPCLGDSNCDGEINWRDIDYFVAAMNDNVAAWVGMFAPYLPACPFRNNDVNDDGTVNWRDIDPLVAVMNTQCP